MLPSFPYIRIDLIDCLTLFSFTYFSLITVYIWTAGASGLPRPESPQMACPERPFCRVLETQSWKTPTWLAGAGVDD